MIDRSGRVDSHFNIPKEVIDTSKMSPSERKSLVMRPRPDLGRTRPILNLSQLRRANTASHAASSLPASASAKKQGAPGPSGSRVKCGDKRKFESYSGEAPPSERKSLVMRPRPDLGRTRPILNLSQLRLANTASHAASSLPTSASAKKQGAPGPSGSRVKCGDKRKFESYSGEAPPSERKSLVMRPRPDLGRTRPILNLSQLRLANTASHAASSLPASASAKKQGAPGPSGSRVKCGDKRKFESYSGEAPPSERKSLVMRSRPDLGRTRPILNLSQLRLANTASHAASSLPTSASAKKQGAPGPSGSRVKCGDKRKFESYSGEAPPSERKSLVMRPRPDLGRTRPILNLSQLRLANTASHAASSLPTSASAKKQGAPGPSGSRVKCGDKRKFESYSGEAPPVPVSNPKAMWMEPCETLLERLMSHEHAWAFNEPADVVKFKIPDYYDIIKHPMDLGTIKSNIASGAYKNPWSFAADVRLTFTNAKRYSPPCNGVHVMADTMREFFEARWKPIQKKLSAAGPHSKREAEAAEPPVGHSIVVREEVNQKMTNELNEVMPKEEEKRLFCPVPGCKKSFRQESVHQYHLWRKHRDYIIGRQHAFDELRSAAMNSPRTSVQGNLSSLFSCAYTEKPRRRRKWGKVDQVHH